MGSSSRRTQNNEQSEAGSIVPEEDEKGNLAVAARVGAECMMKSLSTHELEQVFHSLKN